jgi:hypothetical protein
MVASKKSNAQWFFSGCALMLPVGTKLGNLKVDEVFLEYDGPQLFSCIDEIGRRFIAMHAPRDGKIDNWLYVFVSSRRYKRFLAGQISLRKIFERPEDDAVHLVRFVEDLAEVISKRPRDIVEAYLPDKDSFLVEGAVEMPIAASRQIEVVADSEIWGANSDLAGLWKSLRTPVLAAAHRSSKVVADFILDKVESGHRVDVPLESLGRLLSSFQRLFDSLGRTSRRSDAIEIQNTRLDAVAVFPSSFGIRMETNKESISESSGGVIAVNGLIDLISAGDNEQALITALETSNSEVMLRYHRFAELIVTGGYELRLDVGIPNSSSETRLALSKEKAVRIERLLATRLKKNHRVLSFEGRLVVADIRSNFFLIAGDEQVVGGEILPEVRDSIISLKLGVTCIAKIELVPTIDEPSGEVRSRIQLIAIAPS